VGGYSLSVGSVLPADSDFSVTQMIPFGAEPDEVAKIISQVGKIRAAAPRIVVSR
jgi:hypothetical protein